MKIPFNQLKPNDYNPRKLFRGASMEELRQSIEQHGLIEPLVVRKVDSKYEIVCGMRRYHALKELGVKEIECFVKNLNDIEAVDISFMENLQREDLTPIEEAKMYLTRLKMIPEFEKKNGQNFTLNYKSKFIQKLSDLYSVSTGTIANRLSLLILSEEIQNAIEMGELPLTIAYEIARLRQIKDENIAQQYMLQMFEDYKKEKETMSIAEMNRRITGKIEFEKDKESEDEKRAEERIIELKKQIDDTKDVINKEAKKLLTLTNKVYEKEFELLDEDWKVEDEEDEELLDKTESILAFLDDEAQKYGDDTLYEETAYRINELESAISDIQLLSNRASAKSLRVCPYCYASIDKEAIERKKDIFQEELEEKKEIRHNISGMKGFITDVSTKIKRQSNSIASKYKFIEEYKIELEELGE